MVTIHLSGQTISSIPHIESIAQGTMRRYMRLLEEQVAWIGGDRDSGWHAEVHGTGFGSDKELRIEGQIEKHSDLS